eukprot:GHVU01217080.1.p1 GENE.GHVU01217080.1~~GHVU01217080.1.p1  ORF type:complete len:397 (-),score=53.67 GHVU01217080.1:622-1812(-)
MLWTLFAAALVCGSGMQTWTLAAGMAVPTQGATSIPRSTALSTWLRVRYPLLRPGRPCYWHYDGVLKGADGRRLADVIGVEKMERVSVGGDVRASEGDRELFRDVDCSREVRTAFKVISYFVYLKPVAAGRGRLAASSGQSQSSPRRGGVFARLRRDFKHKEEEGADVREVVHVEMRAKLVLFEAVRGERNAVNATVRLLDGPDKAEQACARLHHLHVLFIDEDDDNDSLPLRQLIRGSNIVGGGGYRDSLSYVVRLGRADDGRRKSEPTVEGGSVGRWLMPARHLPPRWRRNSARGPRGPPEPDANGAPTDRSGQDEYFEEEGQLIWVRRSPPWWQSPRRTLTRLLRLDDRRSPADGSSDATATSVVLLYLRRGGGLPLQILRGGSSSGGSRRHG